MADRKVLATTALNLMGRTVELLDEIQERGAAAHVRRAAQFVTGEARPSPANRRVALFLMRMARTLLDEAGDREAGDRLQAAIGAAEDGAAGDAAPLS